MLPFVRVAFIKATNIIVQHFPPFVNPFGALFFSFFRTFCVWHSFRPKCASQKSLSVCGALGLMPCRCLIPCQRRRRAWNRRRQSGCPCWIANCLSGMRAGLICWTSRNCFGSCSRNCRSCWSCRLNMRRECTRNRSSAYWAVVAAEYSSVSEAYKTNPTMTNCLTKNDLMMSHLTTNCSANSWTMNS